MSSKSFVRSFVALAGVAAISACATEAAKQGVSAGASVADSAPPSTVAAAGGEVTPAAPRIDSVVAPDSLAVATLVAEAPVAATPVVGNDSAPPRLIAGRSKHDEQSFAAAIRQGTKRLPAWPAGPTPAPGALLPGKRIVAYYGNPHSKKMGVIGEYPEQQMLGMLDKTVAQWKAADPSTPVMPAIHLVAVVAQGAAGPDGGWRRREGADMIEKTYRWAKSRDGILFLDIQASHSTLQKELPLLLKYLERPDVHLGIDPEFYMHYKREGLRPSSKVGQMMASDVNYAIQTLDRLVTEKKLPPKVLVVHRFRTDMTPDYQNIRPTKNVQVVMHMDGWGQPWLKFDSYHHYIVNEPVQFAGMKLFYHNDTKKGDALLTPREVLQLKPRPIYIQYQ